MGSSTFRQILAWQWRAKRQVDYLKQLELHLLINDNLSLDLDPEAPTYEATSDASLRAHAKPQESGYVGDTYLDALMMSFYENTQIEAALAQPDTQLRDLTRLA